MSIADEKILYFKSNLYPDIYCLLEMSSKLLALLAIAAPMALAATTNTNLQTVFPASSGTTALAAVKTIAAGATFDGGMVQWDRSPSTCNEQAEGGDADAVFLLQDGAVLSNVIIGKFLQNVL